MNGGTISWASKKQAIVAISTAEAEFIALVEASQEAVWLRKLLNDFEEEQTMPTKIYEDNQSCLKIIQNGQYSNRTKHMDTKYYFLKDLQDKNILHYIYCCTELMEADIFTKPIAAVSFEKLRTLIGLINHH